MKYINTYKLFEEDEYFVPKIDNETIRKIFYNHQLEANYITSVDDCIVVHFKSISYDGSLPKKSIMNEILKKITDELFATDYINIISDYNDERGRVEFYFSDEKMYNAKVHAKNIGLL